MTRAGQVKLRAAKAGDSSFLRLMLYEAAYPDGAKRPALDSAMPPVEEERFIVGWGRPTDVGVVAESGDSTCLGAAWVRVLPALDLPGYEGGPVAQLAIGVSEQWRDQGVGTHLVAELLERSRDIGLNEVHLSVLRSNDRALRVYLRTGFVVVSSDDVRHHMRATTYR